MPIEDFILSVFCEIEVLFKELTRGMRLRRRGFSPRLSDSEVLTMEVVGEYLGIDTDKGIWAYFGHHWREWFPGLGSRANFAKQAASLWRVKQRLQKRLAVQLGGLADPIHLVDGFPPCRCVCFNAPVAANVSETKRVMDIVPPRIKCTTASMDTCSSASAA